MVLDISNCETKQELRKVIQEFFILKGLPLRESFDPMSKIEFFHENTEKRLRDNFSLKANCLSCRNVRCRLNVKSE